MMPGMPSAISGLVAVVGVLLGSAALGQVQIGGGGNHHGWWGGVGFAGDIGVTPQESWARGMANTIRAQGEAYENVARGMISYEQARSQYIENSKLWQQTQMERRQMAQQERDEYYASQRAQRERREAMQQGAAPQQLNSSQLDPVTGTLRWPELLAAPRYADGRQQIETLTRIRADAGGSVELNQKLFEAARSMQAALKTQIRDVPPAAYIEARRFLDLLANDARRGTAA